MPGASSEPGEAAGLLEPLAKEVLGPNTGYPPGFVLLLGRRCMKLSVKPNRLVVPPGEAGGGALAGKGGEGRGVVDTTGLLAGLKLAD